MKSYRVLIAALLLAGCGPTGHTAAVVGVTVANELCREIGKEPNRPEWVTVACTVEGVAGPVVVALPARAWRQVQTASIDAGPGL